MRMISRFLLLLIIIIILVFVVWFTVSNQQDVTFNLNGLSGILSWLPFQTPVDADSLSLPAYIWALIIFAVGFIFGMVSTLISGGKGRRKRRALKRDLRDTKKQLTAREKEVEDIRGLKDDIDPVALLKK